MIDTKTLIAMRDELENIQGGVGIERVGSNPEHISQEESQVTPKPSIITDNIFGSGGPSLAESALKAMNSSSGE